MKKPLIGITCNFDPRDTVIGITGVGAPGQQWAFLATDYIDAILRAGGMPVLLPFCSDPEQLIPLLQSLDGFLISGGHDVDPASYGTERMEHCGYVVPERDRYDLFVYRWAYEHKKPVLGICRGIQIINVAMGGTVYQDIAKESGIAHVEADLSLSRNTPIHEVCLEPGSLLFSVYGETTRTNSYHHQAVRQPGNKVVVTARAEDGIIEGIEIADGHEFTVAVQWHPEMMFDSEAQQALLRAFVNACEE